MSQRTNPMLVMVTLLILGGIAILGISTAERRVEAQLVDIAGVQQVVGHHPARVKRGVYQVKEQWMSESLAVYLDGKRCSEPEDYTVDIRLIEFKCYTNNDSVVIVDYAPR